jgi:hypothetical protein
MCFAGCASNCTAAVTNPQLPASACYVLLCYANYVTWYWVVADLWPWLICHNKSLIVLHGCKPAASSIQAMLSCHVSQVNKLIKTALGWNPAPKGGVVSVRKCTGRGLHTWHGLIGYCLKDEGQPWFQVHLYNISDEDLEMGKVGLFLTALLHPDNHY